MASLGRSSSTVLSLIISLAIVLLFDTASSTSRGALMNHPKAKVGFKVSLHHVDSGKNLTKLQVVQNGIKRANQIINTMAFGEEGSSIGPNLEAPVHIGSGEYVMELAIGTPPAPFTAIIDTGSDLIWTQCGPCVKCFPQAVPIYDPKESSTFSTIPCSDPTCHQVNKPPWDNFLDEIGIQSCADGCPYLYRYGDSSYSEGFLATETFTNDKVSVPNVVFGCSRSTVGDGFSQGSGVMGLGGGPLSLVSQLQEPKFSYCFASLDRSEKKSTLFMGSLATLDGLENTVTTTSLMSGEDPTFYYLSLEGMSLGGTRLAIDINKSDDGSDRHHVQDDDDDGKLMVIDSGTTISYIEENVFEELKRELISQIPLVPLDSSSAVSGLEVCFRLPQLGPTPLEFPELVFHFKEGDLVMPAGNYMIADDELGVVCLAMGRSRRTLSGNMKPILGNIQQQNMLVLYDLANKTVSFAPQNCGDL